MTESDVFSTRLDGSDETRLTFKGGRSPRWSVGGVIVYVRRGRRADPDLGYPVAELYTVRSGGGKAHRITFGGGDSPDWSPDGRRLVAVRAYPHRDGRTADEIVIIDPRSRKVRRLTYGGGILPAWSPDGKRIAFVRDNRIISLHLRDGARRVFRVRAQEIGYLDWQARPAPE
jgi:TolB protein